MPGGDRKGPMGMGAMSGRAAGYCAGTGAPGYANPAPGPGLGMGFRGGRAAGCGGFGGGRRGRRNQFYATGLPGYMRFGGYAGPFGYPTAGPAADVEIEKRALREHAAAMQAQLDSIKKRLSEIETDATAP